MANEKMDEVHHNTTDEVAILKRLEKASAEARIKGTYSTEEAKEYMKGKKAEILKRIEESREDGANNLGDK